MNDSILSRAYILIQQQKYAEAEKLLNDLLSTDPNNTLTLTLLAEVCLQQENIKKAETLIDTAIGISPDSGHLFYIKARVSLRKDLYDLAEKNLEQAIQLDPTDADFYALWASVKLTRKQFEKALELANKSLELDAENILGLNSRSTALLKLDRKDDSFKTIEGALREDPNNAFTHANYGWNLLEKGDHKKALYHFREALKNDPNFEYAQAGMLEALKANNVFYRWFLKYTFWIGNLTAKYQWGVIIGFYLGVKILRAVADNNETLRPYLIPLIVLLSLIAFSTWVITPVSNLFLRINAYGRYLLSKKEIASSNFVGISFIIFLLGVGSYFITADDKFLTIAVFGFSMMVPFGVMFSPSKYKHSLLIYAIAMAAIGIGAIAMTFSTGEIFNALTPVYMIGFVAFQWVANYLMIKESNV